MTPSPDRAYYNEWEPFPAQWLRNLAAANRVMPGFVDERSINDVKSADLDGFTRAHFFAGIGGWEEALRLAGWPAGAPVWTGSCPCQPFSAAGKRAGAADERHLWPAFYRLIAECHPPIVFGEQVASADGRAWLSAVRADLEALGYAVGAADLGAAGVGAPHIRQRLWWVAYRSADGRLQECANGRRGTGRSGTEGRAAGFGLCSTPDPAGLGDSANPRLQDGARRAGGNPGSVAELERSGVYDPWSNPAWLPCSDGKARPTQPGLFPLAHGVPGRVGKLRAAGNAIVPQVGAAFIRSFMEAVG